MSKSGKTPLKFYIGKLHLWLGFSTGLVVFIVAVTGCLYCFQEEITSLYDDYKFVETQDEDFIPPSEARDIASGIIPDRIIHGIAYGDKSDAIEVVFYEPDPEFYQMVYLNPYTGEFISRVNVLEGFFHFILDGHMNLWMGEFGRTIVGFSTLVFLFILISGLILWFPKKRDSAGKRVRFQWTDRTQWKRMMQEYPDAYEVEMHIPPADGYTIYAHMRFSEGTYWDTDYRYFDSRTLEEVSSDSPYRKLEEASVPDLIRLMNYDIHVGAIGGIAGKIIVFFSALIVGSLSGNRL